MIGEMRDFDTAHIGIQSSLTGHLVLSTLHTNDSVSAISRLVDMGIEPYLIAGSLRGIVAQRLVRRICPECKKPAPAPVVMKELYGIETAFRGAGCAECSNTGYKGRFGLYEQFDVTPEISEAITSEAPISALRAAAKKNGLRTLTELGLKCVSAGDTTPEEMLRVIGEE
jgi:type II secretory ATPase GspE/PulE/Tfp pilus assembly ATPase PilB-like protein